MSRDKADTLLLLFSCVLVLAPHVAYLPLWVSVASAALLLWRGWITFRGLRMPPQWLLLPIAAAGIGSVYLTFHHFFGRESGVAMVVLLLVLKLLEMHAKRDLFVVVLVSFFVMLTNFLYSQTIAMALMMVAALIAILTTQVSFQYTGVVPPIAQRLRLGASIFALAVPLTLVLFFLFPRIQGPLWSMPGDAGGGHTGLSEDMSPGSISDLAQSGDLAFRVKFADLVPAQSYLYWRAIVFDYYDGRTWTGKHAERRRIDPQSAVAVRGKGVHYEVTLEPTSRRWLYALDMPSQAPDLPENPATFSPTMQLLAQHPVDARIRYAVTSFVDYRLQSNGQLEDRQTWLQLPPGFNPKTLELAAQLRAQSPDDIRLVAAVLEYFHTQKFSYTLQPPLLGRDAVDEFLFQTQAGFCEHYAGAFTYLMRAMGIPARVVTGYQGGELNPVDDYLVVSQSDAHAWAEVWIEGQGWVRIDPTAAVAPERIQRNLYSVIPRTALGGLIQIGNSRDGILTKLRFDWGAINNAWNQWVLDYNTDKQKSFVESFGFGDVDWRMLIALMACLGVVVTAIMSVPLLLRKQKRDPIQTAYDTLCKRMEKRGLARELHEGPRDYGMRLAATAALSAERKAAVGRFLNLYQAIRYGAPGSDTARHQLSQLKSLLAQCT
jgi:transglutaminase-like putative cysteine protease